MSFVSRARHETTLNCGGPEDVFVLVILRDVGYALRQLRKSPTFALLAILTLALGIGASTAVFTMVDSVLLKPLNYRNSGQLVAVWERVKFLGPTMPYVGPNPRHADLWQKRATAFSSLTLLQEGASGVALGSGHPELTGTIRALPNLLEVLQVTPILGRSFRPEDGVKGRDDVAILTYALWQRLFHGDPAVIGRRLRIADVPCEVIGVLPASFHFPNANALTPAYTQRTGIAPEPAILVPAVIDLNRFDWNGEYGNWIALGRLKPSVTTGQAEAQLNTIKGEILREIPPAQLDPSDRTSDALLSRVEPMQHAVVGGSRMELWMLMAAVTVLLLIACVNLANAQLGRAVSRKREAAIRSALGAGRWQMLWNSLAESLLLALAGGASGIFIAVEGLELFARYAPIDLPRMAEVHVNMTVLFFAMVLTMGSAVLFGTMPALNHLRADPQKALQQNNSRTQGSRESRRTRRWLIGFQVFGCTALLMITGLFAKSLLQLLGTDKGFDTGQVTVAEVDLPGKTYDTDQSRVAFDDQVLARLRALPGVVSAALVSAMPLEGETWIDGINRPDHPTRNPPLANFRWVSAGYFETIRERLVGGRFFDERDAKQNSIVISEAAARAGWPGENPLGRQIKHDSKMYSVIGIAADARNNSLKQTPANMVYFYFADDPPQATFFLVRSANDSRTVVSDVRRAIWRQTSDVTIARVKTLQAQMTDSLATERFQTTVLAAFGGAALLLAMLGVYGVLSYSVAARTPEIGVRMALGATRESIYGLTVKEVLGPVLTGIAAGLAASVALGRIVETMLYGVGAVDLRVGLIVGAVLVIAAGAASWIPARRAASLDPMRTLRAE